MGRKIRIPTASGAGRGELIEALIKLAAVGIAGGAALISGSRRVGEKLQESLETSKQRLEERRKADMAEAARIADAEENAWDK